LIAGLRGSQERHALIGDVRGSGLFLGIDFVRDPETREPAPDEASYIVNRLRDRGILAGTDGPHHNVIKLRPRSYFPMPMPTSLSPRSIPSSRKTPRNTGVEEWVPHTAIGISFPGRQDVHVSIPAGLVCTAWSFSKTAGNTRTASIPRQHLHRE